MKKTKTMFMWLVAALIIVIAGQGWAANMISLNFSENSGNQRFVGGELIGPLKTDSANWNMSDDYDSGDLGNGSIADLIDDTGANTGVSVTWTSSGVWYNEDGTGDDEHRMAVGYLDDWSEISITFSNIPYTYYRVYCLLGSDWGSPVGFADQQVNGTWVMGGAAADNTQQFNASITDNNAANGEWWTPMVAGSSVIGNYWVQEADGPSLNIKAQVHLNGQSYRGTVNAVIIEEIDIYQAMEPDPAIGEEVTIDKVLSWSQHHGSVGTGVTYQVYLGSDPNTWDAAPVKTTTADPADFFFDPDPDLAKGTAYIWRVDALEPNDGAPVLHTGAVWTFTTQPDTARVETDPASMVIPAGIDAQLSVATLNATIFQWYKDGAAIDDQTDTKFIGEDSAALTIVDPQLEDEGYYHCVVDNSLGIPDTSADARVLTRRLIGWWKLDGNLEDSVDSAIAGAPAHDGASVDPNFVDVGKDGGALDLLGDADGLVTMPGTADYFNFYPLGYTVSAWVKAPEKTSGWGAYVTKQTKDGTNIGFILTHNSAGQAIHTLRQSFGDLNSNTDIDDDEWHLVVGTYDATMRQGKVYVDGFSRNATINNGIPGTNTADLLLGAEVPTGNDLVAFIGQLDDVRLYTYPLDPVTIANLYVDFNPGEEVCTEYPEYDIAGPDGVGDEFRDCIVNIYDLLPAIDAWLECNIVPTCIQ